MAQLQFEISKLDSRFASGGDGEAFQLFVFELLKPELPHLHPYPAGGKDGGIDHLTNTPGQPRTVVECKFCGTDGFDEVRKRWKVTEGNLTKNLEPADKPAQSQYAPWYRTNEPIAHYIFTTSARLENPARCDELKDLIRDFFHALAAKHVHLAHLSTLVVEVRDWNFIEPRVPAILRFRWFPGERPVGLRLLASEDEAAQGFRAWLRSSKLPFYSRAEHLAIEPAPSGGDLPDEKALLGILGGDQGTLGLILVGQGGVGKTRLALEIGQTAVADGWTVWVVHRRLKTEALDQLAARMDENSRVLLVFDYVETHPEFANVVQHLADIVDDTGHHIRYVATCRNSYYRAIKGVDRQREIKLSMAKPAAEAWLMSYRRATVRHILDHADISLDEQNIAACHDLPVLAAFLHWLHYGDRTEELQSLLGEEAFGKWVINRLKLSFPGRDLDHSLARLIALFPIPALGRSALTDDERELFYRLEQDGWIEKADDPSAGETAWQTAHDVMADQVALEWLKSIGSAAHEWCSELLREAIRFHALPSALRSLQRLAEHLPISEDEWGKLLLNEAQREPQAWRSLRSTLLRTSLLQPSGRIRLLSESKNVFEGAEQDEDFQNTLGDLLRHLVETRAGSKIGKSERAILNDWLHKTIPLQKKLQFLRAWALRWDPSEFQADTLEFILKKNTHIQTHLLLSTWVRTGLSVETVKDAVTRWCRAHSETLWFCALSETWLEAKGSPTILSPFLVRWFAKNHSATRAPFLLSAWLRNANEPDVVKGILLRWIENNGESIELPVVLTAWLKSGSDPSVVQESVLNWLKLHANSPRLPLILTAWLKHAGAPQILQDSVCNWLTANKNLPTFPSVLAVWLRHANAAEAVQESLLSWLSQNGESSDVPMVLSAWMKNDSSRDIAQSVILEWIVVFGSEPFACEVLSGWLSNALSPQLVEHAVLYWLARHGDSYEAGQLLKAWFQHSGMASVANERLESWLVVQTSTLEKGIQIFPAWIVRPEARDPLKTVFKQWLALHKTAAEASHVYNAWLDAGGEKALVEEPIREWLALHKTAAEASHVYKAWLDAGGEKALVEESIREWLALHKTAAEAGFVYKAWLDAGGEKALVEEPIREWLALHKTAAEASHVYNAWLDAGGEKALVEESIREWLAQHKTAAEAEFVYKAWLDAGGDKALVQVALLAWLGENGTSLEASHVLAAWLESKGALELVDRFVLDWLPNHAKTFEDGSYVLRTWLRAGGDPAFGISFVMEWLSIHGEELDAQFVLAAWLKAKNNPHPLKAGVIKWLLHHGTTSEASHVIGPWLDAGGEYLVVSQSAVPWANKFGTEFEASYVLAACLKINAARSEFEQPAVNWLEQHAATQQAAFIFTAWIKAGLKAERISLFVDQWLRAYSSLFVASHVICAWIDAKAPLDVVREAMLRWLAARRPGDNTSWVLVSWLRAGGARDDVAKHVEKFLANGANPKAVSALRNHWAN